VDGVDSCDGDDVNAAMLHAGGSPKEASAEVVWHIALHRNELHVPCTCMLIVPMHRRQ